MEILSLLYSYSRSTVLSNENRSPMVQGSSPRGVGSGVGLGVGVGVGEGVGDGEGVGGTVGDGVTGSAVMMSFSAAGRWFGAGSAVGMDVGVGGGISAVDAARQPVSSMLNSSNRTIALFTIGRPPFLCSIAILSVSSLFVKFCHRPVLHRMRQEGGVYGTKDHVFGP